MMTMMIRATKTKRRDGGMGRSREHRSDEGMEREMRMARGRCDEGRRGKTEEERGGGGRGGESRTNFDEHNCKSV